MRIHPIVIVAAALSLNATAAFAVPIPDLAGSYSITEIYTSSHGGPSITDNFGTNGSFTITTLPPVGTETTKTNFFTASPQGSCSGGGCAWSTLPSMDGTKTETDPLTITFSNIKVIIGGVTATIPTLTEYATFTAKYGGAELPCAKNDGKSPTTGDTDCLLWTGATANDYTGVLDVKVNLGNYNPALAGHELDIFLYNATDWNITPQIGFELEPYRSPTTPIPEPGSLTLLGGGLIGLGLVGASLRRRHREDECHAPA